MSRHDHDGAAPTQIDPDRPCPHQNFAADVTVDRIGTGDSSNGRPAWYSADITVSCADCGERFRWVGVDAGLSPARPMVSVDETELRAPIWPASDDPDFGLSIPGYALRVRPPRSRPGRS